jgi:hypothetical protein
MKKFSFLPGTLILSMALFMLLAGCAKEQTATTEDPAATSSDANNIAGVSGFNTPLPGSVDPAYAAALAANYKAANLNTSLKVAFSTKDLIEFLKVQQGKYKSSIIYVNFGVYGQGAHSPKGNRYDGRLTVFFTGNGLPSREGSSNRDGLTLGDPIDEFLNHGDLLP